MPENQEEKILAMLKQAIQNRAREKGKSIAQLVRDIDMSEPGFYKMLDSGSIKVKTLVKIADVLESPLESFFIDASINQKVTGNYNNTGVNSTFNDDDSKTCRKENEMLKQMLKDKEAIIELMKLNMR